MRHSLTVLEHGTLAIGRPSETCISEEEADRLEQTTETRPGFCTRQRQLLRFSSYAGLISTGDRMLEVLPKVDGAAMPVVQSRGTLLRLLRLAPSSKIHRTGPADHGLQKGSLLEVFLNSYFSAVGLIIRGGLLRRYSRESADLTVVRGRLALHRQLTHHAMRPDLLACDFHELSSDNPWNRALKVALRACRQWPMSLALRRRWTELWAAFDAVPELAEPREIFAPLPVDRQSSRYSEAIRWARWIIASETPDLRAGAEQAPAMLFDTNALFEEAVATVLRRNLALQANGAILRTQDTSRNLAIVVGSERKAVGLRPDLLFVQNGRVTAIADIKWKAVGTHEYELRPERQDVHQLLAYAAAFRCSRLALVYPWHSGLIGIRPTRLRLPEVGGVSPLLDLLCVDVGRDGLPSRLASEWADLGFACEQSDYNAVEFG